MGSSGAGRLEVIGPLLVLLAAASPGPTREAKVVRVVDGDTVRLTGYETNARLVDTEP